MDELDISYFKKKKGFHPLFLELRRKYSSYGRLAGSIKIEDASIETKEALSGLLGNDFKREKDIKVSVSKFEKALTKTIYKYYSLMEIVESYFGEELRSKKEILAEKEGQKLIYFQTYYTYALNDIARQWLDVIIQKNDYTKIVLNYYERDKETLSSIMNNVINALNRLPLKEYERLPIFAATTTKNPHYFDIGTDGGRMLLSALQLYLNDIEGKEYIQSPKSEEITEILSRFNIMRDDINNDVTVFGIKGYYEDGLPSKVLSYAIEEEAVINLPLREVVRLDKLVAFKNKVFVIENSGLYSTLIDKVIELGIDISIICSSGQINLATWKLIDKLVAGNHSIYYSGDFDPEGIIMVYKMKEKYPEHVHYWHLDVESYKLCLSDEAISESRLNQLLNIQDPELVPLINLLKTKKKSGYQERLMDNILEELKKFE
jgi:uncharacterized protein (TIGR02679 family)